MREAGHIVWDTLLFTWFKNWDYLELFQIFLNVFVAPISQLGMYLYHDFFNKSEGLPYAPIVNDQFILVNQL